MARLPSPLLALAALPLSLPLACGVGDTGLLGDGPGGAGGDDPDDIDDIDDACTQTEPIEVKPGEPPDILFVVDKSGSMDERLGSGDRKWPIMRDALQTVAAQYDDGIHFGLMLYPQGDECEAGTVRAEIAPQNAEAIAGALASTSPDGGTPTHTTLGNARAYFTGRPANDRPRYVLLATDGEPNCGEDDDEPTVNESIAAIQSLTSDGIDTFVLGFGGTVNNEPDTLRRMATAGGTGDYFAANSSAQLSAALDAIASEVGFASCSFRIDLGVTGASDLEVTQDGAPVPHDPNGLEGWDYDPDNNTVTFYGAACESIRTGATDRVRFQFVDCGPVVD
jgi:hypothetical protein